jgi:hypothetical protein
VHDEPGDLLPELDDATTGLITTAIWPGITSGYLTPAHTLSTTHHNAADGLKWLVFCRALIACDESRRRSCPERPERERKAMLESTVPPVRPSSFPVWSAANCRYHLPS